MSTGVPSRIGRYRIEGLLGEGGMGVVYCAVDDQLERRVAIKMLRAGDDAAARERFRREARAAASVSHPNVCHLYEIGEHGPELFLVMELLEGRSLAARLEQGALATREAVDIGLAVLSALQALHRSGVVHRDLKPSNVFLTPHGVKLLDFGLARPAEAADGGLTLLTRPDMILGTPHYMAPEQVTGQPADERSDVFALGIVLYEMLTGERPFRGATPLEVFHAIAYERPPALTGSAAVAAVDRVIRKALAKAPGERYQSAESMAADLRLALLAGDTGGALRARPITRLVVLPLRLARPDPEIDFLCFSLADAITNSLSGLESLVVRSSVTAASYADGVPDLKRIAHEADVDVVLSGTLLRAGDQVRVSAQLVEAPGGTVIWTHTSQVRLGDLFELQDDLTARIVDSLSQPLAGREPARRDVPASARAYEFYLRANEIAGDPREWSVARDLYLHCVDEDPRYAPAWARLGRLYRLIGKYGEDTPGSLERAEAALRRALEINPELPAAHTHFALLEVELGRVADGLIRLVTRARRGTAEPDVFVGLVAACRYAGLLDASIAADEEARRLDPNARTSVAYTHWMRGEFEKALASHAGDAWIQCYALTSLGRDAEALDVLAREVGRTDLPIRRLLVEQMRSTIMRNRSATLELVSGPLGEFSDREGTFLLARAAAHVGGDEVALALLRRATDGFLCRQTIAADPWLERLHGRPEFAELLERVADRQREVRQSFADAGGYQVVGLHGRTGP